MIDPVATILERIRLEDDQQERLNPKHRVGVYRASSIGGCARQLAYKMFGETKKESVPPELSLGIFREGNVHHNALRELLGKCGVMSHVEQGMSKKYNHKGVKFTVTGTCDCVWNGIVIDIKSMNTYGFQYLDKNFPSKYPQYIAQIQLYMDMLGLEWGCFIFKDKNTGELKSKHVQYDKAEVDKVLDKLAALHLRLKKKKLPLKPYSKSDWHCKSCQYRIACWDVPMDIKSWEASKD